MKILIIGANGEIGKRLVLDLKDKHEIITAGRSEGDEKVDISSIESIKNMFNQVKNLDACVCVAGDSYTGSLESLDEEKLNIGITNKLIAQANLVLIGKDYINDKGSFTLTSGKMGDKPGLNAVGKAIANGGVNSFALAASLEMPREITINAVSPSKVSSISDEDLINGYLKSIEGNANGEIIKINY